MRPTRDLESLSRCCRRRATRLQHLVDSYLLPVDASKDRTISYVVIEAHNLWAGFSRSFYLSCALNARTARGSRVVVVGATFKSNYDALVAAIRILRNRNFAGAKISGHDEPAWHVPSNMLRLFQQLKISNAAQVQVALSYPTRYLDLLPKTRNFYAHRNLGTRLELDNVARQLGFGTRVRSSEILVSKLPMRPQHVLGDWLNDIVEVIDLMCQ